MAKKKKEETLEYLQMPLPEGRKYSRMTKVTFGGLNKRYTIDSGDLTMESNISTNEYPYLVPSEIPKPFVDKQFSKPISMFAFDNFILVVYKENTTIKIAYIVDDNVYTGILKEGATKDDEVPRSIVQFNVYLDSKDVVNGSFVKKLLIFPDKKSMDFEITKDGFKIDNMSTELKRFTPTGDVDTPPEGSSTDYCYLSSTTGNIYKWSDSESKWVIYVPPTIPDIKYATVHLSRLFGVSDDCVYASGFNDYTNWTFDGVDSYFEKNAWMSQTQSNTKADGNFTGITNYQGHIVCFKRDYMHEIYNNKNPFRIIDIYAEGTIDNRSIQDVDGKLIFVSDDDVKVYTGSNPRIIGYNLNVPTYKYAVSGTDNRNYYLCCVDTDGEQHLFVYDTYTDLWSEQSCSTKVISFAHNKNGMYMLDASGCVYKMDTGVYNYTNEKIGKLIQQEWSFETDLITSKTVDIKHIKKLQMLAELENGADIQVYILYDNEVFEELDATDLEKRLAYSSPEGKEGRFPIRVKPRNTANYGFKLHVEGKGYAKLYELEIFVESGGDSYVSE